MSKYLLTGLFLFVPVFAQAQVTTTGEGTVTATPDTAIVHAGISSEAETAAQAGTKQQKAVAEFQEALKGLKILEKSIVTENINLYEMRHYDQKTGQTKVTGYRAQTHFRVTIKDFSLVYKILPLADSTSNLQFVSSELNKITDEARKAAVMDAKRKAQLYAVAADAELGKVLKIEESGGYFPAGRYSGHMLQEGANVQPGEQTIKIKVSITWSLK
jgi:uncharacterized protein YggE